MIKVNQKIEKFFSNLYYSFPVQLFLLQMKKHLLLLTFWLLLLSMILQASFKMFGIPYLFLDPEYLGKVDFWSFLVLGLFFGGFIMSYNIASYILNGFRFPFLATLARPFFKYSLNNFILPLVIFVIYCIAIVKFQANNELRSTYSIALHISGLTIGTLSIIILVITYFFNTNKDIFKMFGVEFSDQKSRLQKHRKIVMKKDLEWSSLHEESQDWRVDNYLGLARFPSILKLQLVRGTEHYDPEILKSVFKQNHSNALLIQSIAFVTLLALSLLNDYSIFQIPAGASILLLLSIIMMFLGAVSFWLRGWRTTIFIVVIIIVNFLFGKDFFNTTKKAYGLDYDSEYAIYDNDHLLKNTHQGVVSSDIENTIEILNNWKRKVSNNYQNSKPKIVIITASGGGLRSALWTLRALQFTDSVTNGNLMDHTALITGASAGLIAASYYRELYYQQNIGKLKSRYNEEYLDNLSNDMLNPVAFSMFVNDMFLPIQKFNDGKYSYIKDRGYAFEQQINKNTNYLLNKRLVDYIEIERTAEVPMVIITPTILNDGRKLLISPQPISYLTSAAHSTYNYSTDIDAVEFTRFFEMQDAFNLKFTSALRMSATFPYVTPTISLPSVPLMDVMDAGIRDNYGMETTIRFLNVFKDWISINTSGIILVQIRDTEKIRPIEETKTKSILDKFFNPLSGFTNNWSKFQDYNHDNFIYSAKAWFPGNIDVIRFQYIPENIHEKAVLSWHLTTREKHKIKRSIFRIQNQKAVNKLKALLHVGQGPLITENMSTEGTN